MAAEASHQDACADIELYEHAISKLREALAQAQAVEAREALQADANALRAKKAELQHRIQNEYPEAGFLLIAEALSGCQKKNLTAL